MGIYAVLRLCGEPCSEKGAARNNRNPIGLALLRYAPHGAFQDKARGASRNSVTRPIGQRHQALGPKP
jgi:hypothetical protein